MAPAATGIRELDERPFHVDVPDEYILRVADVMLRANHHTYQVLTKRAGRLRSLLGTSLRDAAMRRHSPAPGRCAANG